MNNCSHAGVDGYCTCGTETVRAVSMRATFPITLLIVHDVARIMRRREPYRMNGRARIFVVGQEDLWDPYNLQTDK